ncbi:hypothetical protein BKA83DRAFT_4123756 [Pisolithus microcarpus]|nr:hypothetical protein BKA83DRAFT_4123756 [Pisolithus microcarpus]
MPEDTSGKLSNALHCNNCNAEVDDIGRIPLAKGEQTTDGVPNAAFEALIDLLTFDGIDDAPPSTATVPRARVTPERAAFRDQSGRLDFEKICSMFEGQNHAESQGRIPAGAGEPDRRVLDSLGGGTQTDVVNRRDITGGYPDVDGAVPPNHAPPPRDVLATPFSFDQLNDALGSACDEMRTLCRQYDELQRLVAVRLGKGKELKGSERKTTQKVVCGAHDSKTCRDATAPSGLRVPATTVQDGTEAGPQNGPKQVGDDGIAAEVARLSEEEARRALTAGVLSLYAIASMTNVRPSALLSGDPSSAPFKSSPSTRGNLSPQDISRALDFVERVDEIIWRRSSLPTNSSLDPIFSAGNVEGLLSRLDLWEKMSYAVENAETGVPAARTVIWRQLQHKKSTVGVDNGPLYAVPRAVRRYHGPPRKGGASAIRRVTLCRERSSSHPCQNERGLMYYVRAHFPEMKKMKMVLSLPSRASGLQTIGRLLISSRLTPENGQTLDAHCLSSPLRRVAHVKMSATGLIASVDEKRQTLNAQCMSAPLPIAADINARRVWQKLGMGDYAH